MAQDQKALELLNLLSSSKYRVPQDKIREKIGCSRSTFFRIKSEAESLLGVKILLDKKYGGYFLEKPDGSVESPRQYFSMAEIESLVMIEHALTGLQGGSFSELLGPIRDRFLPLLKSRRIPIDSLRDRFKILSVFSRKVEDAIFRTAFEGLVRKRRLQIEYRALGSQECHSRVVSPQNLLRYRDNWYLDAFCHERQSLRCFALSRVAGARLLKEKIQTVTPETLEKHYAEAFGIFTGPATRTARIRFTGVAAIEVPHETWHPAQTGETLDDGSYVLSFPYGNDTELVMDVLKWGKDAEVLEPAELREKVGMVLREAARKYEGK